jgi:uncharacterized protein YutE (UPF0331/DUF86 family)
VVPAKLRAVVVLERLGWIQRMLAGIRELPLGLLDDFTADPRTSASAESYLRRCLEALLDLGRHILAKGFGRAASEYSTVAHELQEVGVLSSAEATLRREMAGYRNRLVHFYDEVSVAELHEICTQGLPDVERIARVLEQWVRDHPERIDKSL